MPLRFCYPTASGVFFLFFFPIGDTQSLARQNTFFSLDNISKHVGVLSIVLWEYRIPFFRPPRMPMPHFLLTSNTFMNDCSFKIFFLRLMILNNAS